MNTPESGLPHAQFGTRNDHNRWQIDTSLTFKGKRCKTLNPDLLFSIFGRYIGDEPLVVQALMIKWINDNRQAFDKVTFIGMIGKDVEFDTCLLNIESPHTIGDEFALYALCKAFNTHARVLTMGNTWHTVSVKGTYGERYVEDVCDIHLLFLTRDTIAELKRRTTGALVLQEETQAVQSMVKPLGLWNMELPELPIPELPDETVPSTSGMSQNKEIPQPQTGEYVTSLERIIPLPEKDLEITRELLQCDPDIFELDKPEQIKKLTRVNTLPCSINLRCLEQCDIIKWQMQKIPVTLPDRTENVPSTKDVTDQKYNLRKREWTASRSHSDRPQREASKSVTYAEPTDESSQDSQIFGTIYPMDNRPIPDAKLEKIVGMNKPSAYRLDAQNYIVAKKRGEIPPPPKHTLPSYKPKSETEPENKTTEESVDSEATEDYPPPELPDRTKPEQPKTVRGKLQITKLT